MTDLDYMPFTDEQLWDFIEYLKIRNFEVGSEQFYNCKLVLHRLQTKNSMPIAKKQLVEVLGPILCINQAQQKQFPSLFSIWQGRISPSIVKKTPTPTKYYQKRRLGARDIRRLAQYFLKKIAPKLLPVILVVLLTFLTIQMLQRSGVITDPIFPVKEQTETTVHQTSAEAENSGSVTSSPPPDIEEHFRQKPEIILLIISYIVFMLAIFLRFFRPNIRRRKCEDDLYNLEKVEIKKPENSRWCLSPPAYTATAMRSREYFETNQVDVEKTVRSCAAAAGFYSPVYQMRSRIPEYLILIEKNSQEDLRAHRVISWIEELRSSGVFIEYYLFDSDPRTVFSEGSREKKIYSLAEIQALYSESRLLICTEGEGFVSRLKGVPKRWVSQFSLWTHRSILTLVPVADWGAREKALAGSGFLLLPSRPESLSAITDARLAQKIVDDEKLYSPPPYPREVDRNEWDWLDENKPDDETVSRGLIELRNYLGSQGYTWLAACAVYPEINANLALYLNDKCVSHNKSDVTEKFVRLPWLRHSFMPHWLRRRLLDSLGGKDESNIRNSIKTLLSKRSTSRDTFFLNLSVGRIASRLLGRRPKAVDYRHPADAENDITEQQDRLYISWVQNRLAMRIPRAVLGFLRRKNASENILDSRTLSSDGTQSYKVSTGISWRAAIYAPLYIGIAIVLSALYGWLTYVVVDNLSWFGRFLSIGIIGIYGLLLAVVSGECVRSSKIRGKILGFIIGSILFLVSFYSNWNFWLYAKYEANLLNTPILLFTELWDYLSWDWVHWFYLIVLIVEVVVIGMSYVMVLDQAQQPFCTRCQNWAEGTQKTFGPIPHQDIALEEISRANYTRLYALALEGADKRDSTQVKLELCDSNCAGVTLLSVNSVVSDRSLHGAIKERDEEKIIDRAYVPLEHAHNMSEWVSATKSVLPNLISEERVQERKVVDALMPYAEYDKFTIFGEHPEQQVSEAKSKIEIKGDILGLLDKSGWFIVPWNEGVVFTEAALQSYHGQGTGSLLYEDVDIGELESMSPEGRDKYLNEKISNLPTLTNDDIELIIQALINIKRLI